jgi:mRNA interferase RelE/StbE
VKRALYKARVPDDVAALIRGLHPQLKKKLRVGLEAVIAEPYSGKALRQELAGLWSYRVGHFRIVYRIGRGKIIEVVAVGPRERIYEETYRLLRR